MSLREELRKGLDATRAEAKTKWAEFAKARDEVNADPDIATKARDPESDVFQKLHELHEGYARKADEAELLHDRLMKVLDMEDGPANDPESKRAPRPHEPAGPPSAGRSIGELFTESEQFKALIESGTLRHQTAAIRMPPVEVLDAKALVTGASDTSAGAFVEPARLPGYVDLPQRPLFLRDLVTVVQTDSDTIEYVEVTDLTNSAAEVAEATATGGGSGTKPESGLALIVRNRPIATIAHWIPMTRQSMQDAPQVRGIVDRHLRDGIDRRLDEQMMAGDGIAPNISGILDHDIQEQAPGGDELQDSVLKAITKIRLAYMEPNAVALHPTDWETIQLTRDTANGGYLFGGPITQGAATIWGLRPVINTALTEGEPLVGDFSQATLFIRSGITVLASDSHADFFIRNMVALLAEMRAGFAVIRPDAFAVVRAPVG